MTEEYYMGYIELLDMMMKEFSQRALENHSVDIQSELLDCKWSFNRRMGFDYHDHPEVEAGYAIKRMLDIYLDIGEYIDAGVGAGLVVPVHSVKEKLDNDC